MLPLTIKKIYIYINRYAINSVEKLSQLSIDLFFKLRENEDLTVCSLLNLEVKSGKFGSQRKNLKDAFQNVKMRRACKRRDLGWHKQWSTVTKSTQ